MNDNNNLERALDSIDKRLANIESAILDSKKSKRDFKEETTYKVLKLGIAILTGVIVWHMFMS